MKKLRTFLLLLTTFILFLVSQKSLAKELFLEMESFNEWNLPFSCSIPVYSQVQQERPNMLNSTQSTVGAEEIESPQAQLIIDPTAIFSIIFLDRVEQQGEKADLVQLNYTFFGEENLLAYG